MRAWGFKVAKSVFFTGGSAVGSASALGAEGREFESRPPDIFSGLESALNRRDYFLWQLRLLIEEIKQTAHWLIMANSLCFTELCFFRISKIKTC